MQVSVETTGSLGRSLTVDLPEERISSAVEAQLRDLGRTSQVQGFRPGKAPLRVLRQRFGSQVRREVVEKLISSSFVEAVTQEDLEPVGAPLIDPLRAEVGSGLSYTATFEVMPEIRLHPVEDLQIEKPVCEVDTADVDRMIDKLRRQRCEFREVERAAGEGDRVNIDYQGLVDGEARESLKAENVDIEIGAGTFIPGLEQGLEGSSAGQSLELDTTFPEASVDAELAGKPVVFQVQVNQVAEAVLPDLDAGFFELFGVSGGEELAFRLEIRNYLEREVENALRERYRDSIMQALHEANEIELPRALVNAELERMQEVMRKDMERRGLSREVAARLAGAQELEQEARRRVSLQLLTGELVRVNELEAKPEKVREIIEAMSGAYEDSESLVNWFYGDKERLAGVEARALEDELIDWIAARGKISECTLSFDELMNKGQTNVDA